jgi:hypothetical protein
MSLEIAITTLVTFLKIRKMINFYKYHNDRLHKADLYELPLRSWSPIYNKTPKEALPTIEHIISRYADESYAYAAMVKKGRWIEAEPTIMKDSLHAYLYAKEILKCRWPEAEPYIMTEMRQIFYYAKYVIKGRWVDAEETLEKNGGHFRWELYRREFGL